MSPKAESPPSGSVSKAAFRSRPDFMTVTFFGALLLTSVGGLLSESLLDKSAGAAPLSDRIDARVRGDLMRLGWAPVVGGEFGGSSERGVELLRAARAFELRLDTGTVTALPPAPEAQRRALSLVRDELARYPASFLRQSALRRVLLCSSLMEEGLAVPSLPNFESTLLLDVDGSPAFLRRLLHHEIYHFADFAEDDTVRLDPVWSELNDRYFVYGDGGRHARAPAAGRFREDLAGFVSEYARSALEEDKAETFAFLMTRGDRAGTLAERDPVIGRKLERIQTSLSTAYPDMGAAFWSKQTGRPR